MEHKIKYTGDKDGFKKMLYDHLDKVIAGEIVDFEIENIPSATFCEIAECEADDFNGWQCDWWGSFSYNNHVFSAAGCAWYATVGIGLQ